MRTPTRSHRSSSAGESAGETAKRRKTILLVDDVAMFRDLGALFLARSGRVITADNGEDALVQAKTERPDLVIVDLLMPGIDGEAVCRFIKSDPDLHTIPVVMLVGVDTHEEWGRAVRAGADDVLAKPLSRIALVETVNRFLRDTGTRGLPRIPVSTPVEFQIDGETRQGTVRNLSRGGLFLETDRAVPGEAEVRLHFALPENETDFHPTAQVVWQIEKSRAGSSHGIGMRFVSIDGSAIRSLEAYVFERNDEPVSINMG